MHIPYCHTQSRCFGYTRVLEVRPTELYTNTVVRPHGIINSSVHHALWPERAREKEREGGANQATEAEREGRGGAGGGGGGVGSWVWSERKRERERKGGGGGGKRCKQTKRENRYRQIETEIHGDRNTEIGAQGKRETETDRKRQRSQDLF